VAIVLVLLIVGIVGAYCYNRRQANLFGEVAATVERPVIQKDRDGQLENEELIAIIMAAVAEFEGTNNFYVLNIRPSNGVWQIANRLILIRNQH